MGMGFYPAIFVYRQAILLTQDVNSIPKCSNEYAPLVRAASFLRRMSALMGQWVSTKMMSRRIELKYSAILLNDKFPHIWYIYFTYHRI